ncbi:type I restriction-modification system subunit M [Enterococcus casseliflavus]|uniref:type I restriction-modification system subunit M n=1 Tax=Enterococcus casseliflavus TaxID=37734 RepID=UPI00201D28B3|nr:class I SAM-dependent DNA methyltransferase [Enterococcus casseliflavus]MDT2954427.1 class I SAM-dependent DNA methyltransferase [Enterococcus casseliflavus]MDT2957697.1 class I SAM-dependent DNA methyltransferase [Enterococcus casseliflavus]UQZ98750.1 SAM-dependent DNA methyltransferase [Enterococcus casseliflavus]
MNEIDRHLQTNINIQEKSNLIWNNAEILRGLYKPHEYGEVILPMTVIKRFHDTLLPTLDQVQETYEEYKTFEVVEPFLLDATGGYSFYNTSKFTFASLLSDPEHIEENFRAYLNGFSENVQDVLEHFSFDVHISRLANNDKLYYIIQEFNKPAAYMGADKISSTDMGYIFEDLVRRFSESYNEEAGEHFTSRDIIYLMTDILLAEDKNMLMDNGVVKTVYDQTMGTSQMLSAMTERLQEFDRDAEVTTFGQEINPSTYAIAKADTMIRGGSPGNMKLGNTLTEDGFPGYTFDYCISNPPFGVDWNSSYKKVKAEHDEGENGRFAPGLPRKSDGQLLFTLNALNKLKDDGRMAIIHNGSALFSGSAGSGESEIRRYVIENDWLDAIIQLPGDSFYNTGITTYIWVYSKDKPLHREGKVQLIDASEMYEKRRKNIGSKRVDITEECREVIVQAYGEFMNKEYILGDRRVESKIMNNEDFGFYKVTVESPERDEEGNIILKKGKPKADAALRDSEDIPLMEDIDAYFEREIKPFNPDAWIDKKKTKVGYEVPFTRLFYKYEAPEKSEDIAKRISEIEARIVKSFEALSGEEVDVDGE